MNLVKSLDLLSVWLSEDHLVLTARIVMEGHRIHEITVLSADQQVGFVTLKQLEGVSGKETLERFTHPYKCVIDGELSLRQAASILVKEEVFDAAVMLNQRFLGMLSSNMLLKELSKSWDPMTGLSWVDDVRSWGSEQLHLGRELSVLIFDVNKMTAFNEQHGHDQGDILLQRIAAELTVSIDATRDVLVRHSGNKFLIASLKPFSEAEAFAVSAVENLRRVLEPISHPPVTLSFGASGGRRSGDRASAHPEATLDDLIRLAMEDCEARKSNKAFGSGNIQSPLLSESPSDIKIVELGSTPDAPDRVRLVISYQGQLFDGREGSTGQGKGQNSAQAACRALEKIRPGMLLTVDQAQGFKESDGRFMAMFAGFAKFEGRQVKLSGIVSGETSLEMAMSMAVISAFSQAFASTSEASRN